jgi:hypothetical protein
MDFWFTETLPLDIDLEIYGCLKSNLIYLLYPSLMPLDITLIQIITDCINEMSKYLHKNNMDEAPLQAYTCIVNELLKIKQEQEQEQEPVPQIRKGARQWRVAFTF